jgi:hypothetical protein
MMHSARLTKSERLQRVADVLQDGRPHTTLDILTTARVCAVNSCVSELRANGMPILCKRQGDTWHYQLVRPFVAMGLGGGA